MANELSKLLKSIQSEWDEVNAFLASLTDAQKTDLKDAGGWAVKDHVIHMAVWEDGIEALLNHLPRSARMGIDEETRQSRDTDRINEVIYKQHNDKSLETIMQQRQQIHDRLINTIKTLKDEDLTRPYKDFSADSKSEVPIISWIVGNTFDHYAQHIPWMRAIVDQA